MNHRDFERIWRFPFQGKHISSSGATIPLGRDPRLERGRSASFAEVGRLKWRAPRLCRVRDGAFGLHRDQCAKIFGSLSIGEAFGRTARARRLVCVALPSHGARPRVVRRA